MSPKNPMLDKFRKAVLYRRVSSKEQDSEGFSLAAQERLLRDYARDKEFAILNDYVDVETAKRVGRTAFTDMVSFLRQARSDCRTVLVEKTDRLYRNIKDWVTLDELDVEVHFVKEGYVLSEASRSSERFIHGIKVLMAKNYCDNLAEETSKGMRQKASEGIWPSMAPVGYRNLLGPNGKRIIEPDTEIAAIILNIFEAYSIGFMTLREITRYAKSLGLRYPKSGNPATESWVDQILRNPIYMGVFEWNGERFRGTHTPLVSAELFNRVQAVLAGRSANKGHQNKDRWTFGRLLKCGHCGCAIVGEVKKDIYVYYHCTKKRQECSGRYVREEVIDAAIQTALQEIQLTSEVTTWLIKALKESNEHRGRFAKEEMGRLTARRDRLDTRLRLAFNDRLDGRISDSHFDELKRDAESEILLLAERILALDRADFKFYDEGVHLLELVQKAVTAWDSANPEQKRVLLETVGSNSILTGNAVTIQFRSPFDLLAVRKKELAAIKATSKSGKHDIEEWLPRLDSNQRPAD